MNVIYLSEHGVLTLVLQVLKNEVELMARMAKTIDGFTQHQTRLAVVIDGLDSCEQDKVLQMLDTVTTPHRHRSDDRSLWRRGR